MQIPYTKQAEEAIRYAGRMAREMKHPYIGTEHLLLGLRQEYTGVAGQVLAQNGVEEKKIRHLMDERKERNRRRVRGLGISLRTAERRPAGCILLR